MKILSTKVHGILDYIMGALLIASPWLFGFNSENAGAEAWVPILLGVGMILYSIMTNYEYGLTDNISMKAHLILDVIAGLFLAASPWIFGFNDVVYLPHVILGGLEVGAALMTETKPSHETTTRRFENTIHHRHAAHG
jgi:hypothetical protein